MSNVNAAFGRRSFARSAVSSKSPTRDPLAEQAPVVRSTNFLVRWLDGLVLWLPDEEKPGLAAVCVALLRLLVFPLAMMVAPIMVYGLVVSSEITTWRPTWATAADLGLIGAVYTFACSVLVIELTRYAFVRRAADPRRAAIVFAALITASIIVDHHASLFLMAWMIAANVGASFAMLNVRRFWARRALIVAAIVLCQTALLLIMPHAGPV